MHATLKAFLLAIAGLLLVLDVHALELEGYTVPETVTMGARTLVMNGAAVRRLSVFKTEVASLYLESRQTSLEAIEKLSGPKRLHLMFLRDTRSDDLYKRFMSDFRAAATPAERNTLMNEMVVIAGMLSNNLKKGDQVTIDWLPGTGMLISRNASPLAKPITNELMFQIIMRMFMGPTAGEEARLKLLGITAPTQ